MKILEKGPGWSIEQLCTGEGNGNGGCKSRLLVETDDIYVTTRTDMGGDTEYFFTFRCPVCNIETDIPYSDIPPSVQKNALEQKRKRYGRN